METWMDLLCKAREHTAHAIGIETKTNEMLSEHVYVLLY